ncbi:MAG: hypothetical protein N3B12_04985 [Armatimonadetes bacterium]|nr:hypothetical protein [Armatimonadota bacterium]
MKTFGLVLALLVMGSAVCMAASVTIDLYTPWNYIACPLVPFDPNPESVFAGVDVYYNLFRYDAATGSEFFYDGVGPFGNILLGEGYYLLNVGNVPSISYSGVPDGVPDSSGNMTDMWISLPGVQGDEGGGGWHLIGHPFNHDTPTNGPGGSGDNIWFTDGTTLKTWDEAVIAGWVSETMMYFDGVSQTSLTMTYQGWGNDDTLRAKYAYWVETKKDNLALIIPAYNP